MRGLGETMYTLIELILKFRFLALAFFGLIVLCGTLAWMRLPIDAFPDVTNVQVMVLTEAEGLSAADIEQQVTYPIEQQMGGIPGVVSVRSLSKAGLSQVSVVFEDDTDIYFARQQVFERIQSARADLPASVEPAMGPISTGLGEIFQYTLESEKRSAMELRAIQDFFISPQLKPIKGVNEVNSFGGFVRQYHILVNPDALIKYDLTLRDVVAAVADNNANATGGFIVRGYEQTYIRGIGLLSGVSDISNIVIKVKEGTPVYVSDVANVVIGPQPRQGAVTRDGKGEVVAGMVIMLKGENSKDVVARVKSAIPKIQKSLPEDVRINVFYDRTALIEACIKTVMNALMEGGIFVIAVLFLFAAELRTALIVVTSLPVTFLATFIIMGWAGISSNLMSVGGLAFSVGMVVDASIVIVENIRRHFAQKTDLKQRRRIVVKAVGEVAKPVSFSILIIVIVLVPLFALQGIEGKMFLPLMLTMMIAILVSLLIALMLVPVFSEILLKQEQEKQFRLIRKIHNGYLKLLGKARNHRALTLGVSLLFILVAAVLVPRIGTEFIPYLDEGAIALNVVRLPNASLDGSKDVATFMEKLLLEKFPEIETVVSKTGRAEISEDPMGPEQTDLFIMLKPKKEWKTAKTKAALIEAINVELSMVPGIRLSFSQPIALRVNELISGVKSDLAVKVYGTDLEQLKEVSNRIAGKLRAIRGAQDVKVEQVSGMEQIEIVYDRKEMARFGINVADVNDVVETALAGREVTQVVEGQMRIAAVVKFPDDFRNNLAAIEGIIIPGAGGERVPLKRIADIRIVEGPAQINRENGMRRVATEVNIRDRDLGGFVAEAKQVLSGIEKELPPGYFLEFGGQFENQQRAMRRLSIVVPVALVLILLLLYLALGSVRDSLLVILNLPVALVGGVVAIWAFGMPLSVSAAVSFIVLLGIAVQNGVVLMAFFRQLRQKGTGVAETVQTGCNLRFKPLLMTALTSFIGHLPMLYATGSGADIQKPLAVVVMGGLITCTILTLIVLPTLYEWFETRLDNRITKI